MSERPLRNLLNVAEDQRLWRVFTSDHLKAMFRDSALTLVAPRLWGDPFEDFLARCTVTLSDRATALLAITEGFYGLCWTVEEAESDAAWRIYTADQRRGVRVRVKAGLLFDCIYDPADSRSAISCFTRARRIQG